MAVSESKSLENKTVSLIVILISPYMSEYYPAKAQHLKSDCLLILLAPEW